MSFERRKVRVGRVVSDKMDKTVIVSVEWRRPHRLYRKAVRRRTRFTVHDADNRCTTGDLVRITETRPLSKFKRWKVTDILVHEDIAEVQPEDITVDEPGILVAERRGPDAREADVEGAVPEEEPTREEPVAEVTVEAGVEEAVPEEEPTREEPVAEIAVEADVEEAVPEEEPTREEPVAEVAVEADVEEAVPEEEPTREEPVAEAEVEPVAELESPTDTAADSEAQHEGPPDEESPSEGDGEEETRRG